MRYSLDKSSVELLYLPIPPDIKLQAKSTIDTVIWRLGDGLSGFTLAIFTDRLHWSAQRVSLVNLVFIAGWIASAVAARRRYAGTLLESIRQRRLDAERQFAPVLDRSTADILATQLASPDPKQVLYALELFGASQNPPAHPGVRDLLGHEDAGGAPARPRAPRRRRRPLGAAAGRGDAARSGRGRAVGGSALPRSPRARRSADADQESRRFPGPFGRFGNRHVSRAIGRPRAPPGGADADGPDDRRARGGGQARAARSRVARRNAATTSSTTSSTLCSPTTIPRSYGRRCARRGSCASGAWPRS